MIRSAFDPLVVELKDLADVIYEKNDADLLRHEWLERERGLPLEALPPREFRDWLKKARRVTRYG